MKRSVVIIRFGSIMPLPKELPLIHAIADGHMESAVGMPGNNIGVISILYTDWSLSKIAEAFRELADSTEDVLPVMVSELDGPSAGINFKDFPGFEDAVESHRAALTDQPVQNKIELSLDQLLDLVNEKGGVDQLEPEERKLLEKLTREL